MLCDIQNILLYLYMMCGDINEKQQQNKKNFSSVCC